MIIRATKEGETREVLLKEGMEIIFKKKFPCTIIKFREDGNLLVKDFDDIKHIVHQTDIKVMISDFSIGKLVKVKDGGKQ